MSFFGVCSCVGKGTQKPVTFKRFVEFSALLGKRMPQFGISTWQKPSFPKTVEAGRDGQSGAFRAK